jgi:hypothetical protein
MVTRDEILSIADDAAAEGRWEDAMRMRREAAEIFPIHAELVWACGEAPWQRSGWHGDLVSLDGAPADDFEFDDVERVVGYGDSGSGWDGECAGIALLRDGRFVSWESDWGPTGSGFCEDAYGGNAAIWFSLTAGVALEKIS